MQRRETLEKLARNEISRQEAERLLNEAGAPIPEKPPPAPQAKSGKHGCLIALLVGLVILPLALLLLLVLTFVGCRAQRARPFRFPAPTHFHRPGVLFPNASTPRQLTADSGERRGGRI